MNNYQKKIPKILVVFLGCTISFFFIGIYQAIFKGYSAIFFFWPLSLFCGVIFYLLYKRELDRETQGKIKNEKLFKERKRNKEL